MDEIEQLATLTDPLLACCLCRRLLRDAVQLACLHNCCRQCFSTAASTGSSQAIACGSCGTITKAGTEKPNYFIDCQVQHYASIAESRLCGVCRGNGEHVKPAVVWCPTCRHSLCEDCIAGHRQYFRQHVTHSLEDVSFSEVCRQPSASGCPVHGKALDIACLNCGQTKCISCWAECKAKKHETHIVGDESFDNYIGKFVACITAIEGELLRKAEVLHEPQSIMRDMREARARHLDEMCKRKRRIVDAVEMVYQEIECSTKNAYDDLEGESNPETVNADRIASDLSDARNYIRRLVDSNSKCEIFKQQNTVRERLSVLSAELDSLSNRLATTRRAVQIEASLPEDLENVVRAWIGMPVLVSSASSSLPPQQQQQQQQEVQQQQNQQHFSFDVASASIPLSVDCDDVALTNDGRLLLAAGQHGLIEFCSSRAHELSRWQPTKQSTGQDDCVQAVVALNDRRAAVSLYCAQLVALLRRNKLSGSEGAAVNEVEWIEEHRLDMLPWPARWLSAHGDMLAVCDELSGRRLQLLSLSSGQPPSAVLQRPYSVRSLAVTARTLVTGSWDKVKLDGGRLAQVLDAHSLEDGSDERLWRQVLNSSDGEEELQGVSTDASGSCVYAAVWRSDKSSGRVSTLSMANGNELRHTALSFPSAAPRQSLLLLPMRLSLSYDGAAAEQPQSSSSRMLLLAVLCWDSTTKERRTVTVHRSICDVLQ